MPPHMFRSSFAQMRADTTPITLCASTGIHCGSRKTSLRIAALAALLHDADDHKLFNTKNNANARAFLEAHQVTLQTIERICGVINSVSFKQNKGKAPDTPEGKVVQDADRLDAMGAIGVARAFAYGGEHGRSMADSVQHFYDKLLRLKELMNTDTGRQMAEQRHAFLEAFLKEYYEEEGAKE